MLTIVVSAAIFRHVYEVMCGYCKVVETLRSKNKGEWIGKTL